MKPPFEKALLHLLHRASQVADEVFASESTDLDLTPRQFAVLATIGTLEGPSQTDIVARTGIDRSTLADITRRLVKKKLIGRRRAKDDARAYELNVTPEGKERLRRAHTSLMAAEGVLQSALSVHELDSLRTMLEKIALLDNASNGRPPRQFQDGA